jgi:hypothetical protein
VKLRGGLPQFEEATLIMENNSILLEGVISGVVEHLGVYLAIALILLVLGFFRKRLINLSAWFVPVRVHGNWSTTLGEPTVGTPAPIVKMQENPPSQKVHEYVTLHQFFNKVWGTTFVQNERKDVYQVRGQLVATNLALIFRDKNGFNSGAIFLRVTSKELMEGYEVGVDREAKLYSRVYTWKHEEDKFAAPASGH